MTNLIGKAKKLLLNRTSTVICITFKYNKELNCELLSMSFTKITNVFSDVFYCKHGKNMEGGHSVSVLHLKVQLLFC